ncbi:MAG: 50S ribosomal protein L10 [Owenweeksia sp.]|nr:50S ribosomal protein L10 [Owenweeksia sp.]|tara:strand:- start:1423 stop:1944 length:522 start_codon:yes stop_codon:yes gene_type:complete
MTKEEKNREIESLTEVLKDANILYIADIAGLNAEQTSNLRRMCYKNGIKLNVVKNTLLKKAMERSEKSFDELFPILKGNTSIMISETGNAPAKLIKEFRKKAAKPVLKGAYVDESIYIGDDQVEALSTLKSKEELIGDVIMLLQSPAKNVVSALQSGKNTLAGLMKALEERAA